jgi:hypothetical protein
VDAGRVIDESGSKNSERFRLARQSLGVERSALLFFVGRFGAIGAERDGWSSERWSVGPQSPVQREILEVPVARSSSAHHEDARVGHALSGAVADSV